MKQYFCEVLQNEILEIEARINALKSSLMTSPSETLHIISSKGKYPQYYSFSADPVSGKKKSIYIPKKNISYAKKLAQCSYNRKVLLALEELLKSLKQTARAYDSHKLEEIYNTLSSCRQEMVTPLEYSDEQFVNNWLKKFALNENSYPIDANIITEREEHVRSKSEKIIADKLYRENIPYVYEPKLLLPDGSAVFPDFAALNIRLRSTFFIEHFGMMDDPLYSSRAFDKISKYERNNFFSGTEMLYTFETKTKTLNSRNLENMIFKFLK